MSMTPEELRDAGDWIVQLKVILGKGTDFGDRPEKEHRSTKKAVKLLLSNLHVGIGDEPDPAALDDYTQRERSKKLVFNAVDLLIDDKVAKSRKGKTKLQALEKFEVVLKEEFARRSKKRGALKDEWKFLIGDAITGLRYEAMEEAYHASEMQAEELLDDNLFQARPDFRDVIVNQVDPAKLSEEKKTLWIDEAVTSFLAGGISANVMAGTERGRMLLDAKPKLRGRVAGMLKPAKLDVFLESFPDKDEVAADALLAISGKKAASGAVPDRKTEIDPATFTKLKACFEAEEWNDRARGLGPKVCQALWQAGNYDQIVELIKHGVDTSLAARSPGSGEPDKGIYSGFFQPIQHIVQKHLRDVAFIDKKPCPLEGDRLAKAQGARKILAALRKKGVAKTLTRWKNVRNSNLIDEFERNPGTIWGFEDIRLPYVQAAHGIKQGVQPVRMMELWEAVEASLQPESYAELLKDPAGAADKFVAIGVEKIEEGVKSGDPKYAQIAKKKKEYIQKFKEQAKSFLIAFAAEMPKMTFIDPADPGNAAIALSDIAGVQAGKLGAGLACKAGLWWAQQKGKPVYYCLDGIEMKDVINYKEVRNKAIEDFIAAGGKRGVKGHDEVITMVELREIIKHWDRLQGTVKFVKKGRILRNDKGKLTARVKNWKAEMEAANKAVGRAPAPPREQFAKNLNAIDPGLMAELDKAEHPDLDARDIVRKSGYLVKVANTRPEIVLKYIMSRCRVLVEYGLISAELPALAARLTAGSDERSVVSAQLLEEIEGCHEMFREPLTTALVRHPLIAGT